MGKNLTSFPKKYTTKRKSLRTRMNGKIKKKLRRNVLRSRETNAKTCQEKSAVMSKNCNAKLCPKNLVKWLTRLFVLRNPKQSVLKRRNVKPNQRKIVK